MNIKNPVWRILGLSLAIGALTACNTMEGAGKDLEEAGDAIEDEAEEHNEYTDPYDDRTRG